jgi:hypothetical protein
MGFNSRLKGLNPKMPLQNKGIPVSIANNTYIHHRAVNCNYIIVYCS